MCLLKKTKFGKIEHVKDDLGLKRYSGITILKCLKKHGVNHCIECPTYKAKLNRMERLEEPTEEATSIPLNTKVLSILEVSKLMELI